MNRKILNPGTRFGKRIVLNEAGRTPNGFIRYSVKCDCGTVDIVNGSYLRAGKGDNCRYCARKATGKRCHNFKHGHSYYKNKSKLYAVWTSMKSRCNNPNDHQFKDYGGRGISVCTEWNDFTVFLKDMGEPLPGKEIDRIDNNKGYFKENCRWVSRQENCYNKRNNKFYEVDGNLVSKRQILETLGITKDSLRWKIIRKGEKAVLDEYKKNSSSIYAECT